MSLNNTYSMIQYKINRYFCPISLVFGVIGCFFNIILFSRKQFRNISCCTYFLGASISMMIGLIIGLSPHVYSANHSNPVNKISFVCKIRGYIGQCLAMMYRWLMTIACIDRYLSSSSNINLREFTNLRTATRIVRIIMIIWLILPLHNLLFLDIKDDLCINSKITFAIYHSLFTMIMGGFLPSLIMIIFVILICSNLASKGKRRQRNIQQKNKDGIIRLFSTRDYQVLLMLFVQIGFYILSTIPWMIFLLYAALTRTSQNKSNDRIIIERFVRYLTEIIVYSYPTWSFYIYTLTSETFRSELINVIRSILFGRDRSWYGHRPLTMQADVACQTNSDKSNKIYHFRSIEKETNPINSDQSMVSIHWTKDENKVTLNLSNSIDSFPQQTNV